MLLAKILLVFSPFFESSETSPFSHSNYCGSLFAALDLDWPSRAVVELNKLCKAYSLLLIEEIAEVYIGVGSLLPIDNVHTVLCMVNSKAIHELVDGILLDGLGWVRITSADGNVYDNFGGIIDKFEALLDGGHNVDIVVRTTIHQTPLFNSLIGEDKWNGTGGECSLMKLAKFSIVLIK